MSASPLQISPALLGSPIDLPVYLKAVSAGSPSPADDYPGAPTDLSRMLIQNVPATFIATVAGHSAADVQRLWDAMGGRRGGS
ncbi:hypothetical protein [Bosea sp. (in: a-proteobacteria)]|uniref:hypothetical protein n=1 Tax=Bosea sp. (in: a-proteobacteria) TaxID=1871050 RepID=UPI0011F753D0|nr:hypothetical protein [Bosea sp. (in: a-proteobacteria)]TAJ33279.1 MAG: hypothetical protein EPO59_05765 [Bosea sp. (in: a-proteobacteria)]